MRFLSRTTKSKSTVLNGNRSPRLLHTWRHQTMVKQNDEPCDDRYLDGSVLIQSAARHTHTHKNNVVQIETPLSQKTLNRVALKTEQTSFNVACKTTSTARYKNPSAPSLNQQLSCLQRSTPTLDMETFPRGWCHGLKFVDI